ncbi:MAG: putative adenylyltransferase/sulfurtransferase MoeZ [bacterium ADurb.Bin236]|nr:MAG: putative adenylyltransferase/sulfurtransferase MoeZ [bacterium ADurb.Bin236]HOY63144.1 molybdopterin-synthase adenylyltransferase MoeB [bacterium]
MSAMGEEARRRYARHLMLDRVGETGQAKLLSARVLVVGAGGLGSPVIFYLAAAGVGLIGAADSDVVDISNLQRQILHSTPDIGRLKTDSARDTVVALNPDVKFAPVAERITPDNVMDILSGYDIAVDACDNFHTRYLVNDACALQRKPFVHGGVFQFEGQASTFIAGKGPCYRCLFPTPPDPEIIPRGNEIGLLGVVPGTIGLIQATETVKLILGLGDSLVGRLLIYDALKMRFRELNIRRDPGCRVCGEQPSITNISPGEQSYIAPRLTPRSSAD